MSASSIFKKNNPKENLVDIADQRRKSQRASGDGGSELIVLLQLTEAQHHSILAQNSISEAVAVSREIANCLGRKELEKARAYTSVFLALCSLGIERGYAVCSANLKTYGAILAAAKVLADRKLLDKVQLEHQRVLYNANQFMAKYVLAKQLHTVSLARFSNARDKADDIQVASSSILHPLQALLKTVAGMVYSTEKLVIEVLQPKVTVAQIEYAYLMAAQAMDSFLAAVAEATQPDSNRLNLNTSLLLMSNALEQSILAASFRQNNSYAPLNQAREAACSLLANIQIIVASKLNETILNNNANIPAKWDENIASEVKRMLDRILQYIH